MKREVNMEKIYLAVPYSAISDHLKDQRFKFITKMAARFVIDEINCYSPITNSHLLHLYSPGKLPGDWQTWAEINRQYIDDCDSIYVACLPGWDMSEGVQVEIKYAISIGKCVHLIPAKLAADYTFGRVKLFI